jgi:hypothetical protein
MKPFRMSTTSTAASIETNLRQVSPARDLVSLPGRRSRSCGPECSSTKHPIAATSQPFGYQSVNGCPARIVGTGTQQGKGINAQQHCLTTMVTKRLTESELGDSFTDITHTTGRNRLGPASPNAPIGHRRISIGSIGGQRAQ